MSAESGQHAGQEINLAERPRDGESWREMIERQQREDSNRGGFSRDLLRSLPDEQRQENAPKGRGDILLPQDLMSEEARLSYMAMLRDAAQGASREPSRGIDR